MQDRTARIPALRKPVDASAPAYPVRTLRACIMSKHWGRYVQEGRYRRCLICGRVVNWGNPFSCVQRRTLIHNGGKPK